MTTKCSECPHDAMPETTQCGCDYFCGCQLYPLCSSCYDTMERESYEFIEMMRDPGFNAFYIAHLPADDFDDGFYRFYLESLAQPLKAR